MNTNTPTNTGRTGEPRLAAVASWAVLAASFALSASTWIAMAVLAGFTDAATLPVLDVTLRVAWLMPVAVDGYVVVALVLWMSPVPASVAGFAKKNTYGAAGIGIAAQSAYHLLATQSATDEVWRVALAAIVGALPPAVAALAVHMRALIRRETSTAAAVSATVPRTTATTHTVPAHPAPARPVPPAPAIPATAALDTVSTDLTPHTPPDEAPALVREVPTPADVAARLTPAAAASAPARPAPVRPAPAGTSKPRPRKPAPTPTAPQPAAPATDTPVTAPDAAQLALPIAVDADLLVKAREVATQYRTEHGQPITAGQLATRLKVNSGLASQALAVLDLGPDSPTTPIPTVNGNRYPAAR